jgi:Mg2+ and Co2+ transporter CorA
VPRLIAQKDTKVNIEMARVNIDLANDTKILARASKEDSAVMRTITVETNKVSSSMKTVVVLGMLFLPPTLLAVSCLSFMARLWQELTGLCSPFSKHQ